MVQSKFQFYHGGVDDQKRSDITIDLKRIDSKKIQSWTVSQKIQARSFLADAEGRFMAFRDAILEAVK